MNTVSDISEFPLCDDDIDAIIWYCITNGTKTWKQFAKFIMACELDNDLLNRIKLSRQEGRGAVIGIVDIPGVEGN